MLPSSHVVPIKQARAPTLSTARGCWRTHFRSSSPPRRCSKPRIAICSRRSRILASELAERNAALTSSLAENDRMRATLQQMIDSMPCGVLVLEPAETHRDDQSRRTPAAGARTMPGSKACASFPQPAASTLKPWPSGRTTSSTAKSASTIRRRKALARHRQAQALLPVRRSRTV